MAIKESDAKLMTILAMLTTRVADANAAVWKLRIGNARGPQFDAAIEKAEGAHQEAQEALLAAELIAMGQSHEATPEPFAWAMSFDVGIDDMPKLERILAGTDVSARDYVAAAVRTKIDADVEAAGGAAFLRTLSPGELLKAQGFFMTDEERQVLETLNGDLSAPPSPTTHTGDTP